MTRPILTLREPGVEKLLANLPGPPPDQIDEVRRWAVALMAAASNFQIVKAQQAARERKRIQR